MTMGPAGTGLVLLQGAASGESRQTQLSGAKVAPRLTKSLHTRPRMQSAHKRLEMRAH